MTHIVHVNDVEVTEKSAIIQLIKEYCSVNTSNLFLKQAGAGNNNTQEAALAIMPSTTHPQESAEPDLHERTHNKSSATHNLPVTLPE